jgi:hypothetical protein
MPLHHVKSHYILILYYTSTSAERVGVSQHDNTCSFILSNIGLGCLIGISVLSLFLLRYIYNYYYKMKNKKYHIVRTILKSHIVRTILKSHIVRTILKSRKTKNTTLSEQF